MLWKRFYLISDSSSKSELKCKNKLRRRRKYSPSEIPQRMRAANIIMFGRKLRQMLRYGAREKKENAFH